MGREADNARPPCRQGRLPKAQQKQPLASAFFLAAAPGRVFQAFLRWFFPGLALIVAPLETRSDRWIGAQ
jgi:hypothetical protein